MKLPRRRFLHLAAGAAALPALPRVASALDYPTRPVHIIVGYAPGGTNDISARLMGQWLSERLGRQFVIENRPGAASDLATETVVQPVQSVRNRHDGIAAQPWWGVARNNLSCSCIGGAEVVIGAPLCS
jgi:hypothetical protein